MAIEALAVDWEYIAFKLVLAIGIALVLVIGLYLFAWIIGWYKFGEEENEKTKIN